MVLMDSWRYKCWGKKKETNWSDGLDNPKLGENKKKIRTDHYECMYFKVWLLAYFELEHKFAFTIPLTTSGCFIFVFTSTFNVHLGPFPTFNRATFECLNVTVKSIHALMWKFCTRRNSTYTLPCEMHGCFLVIHVTNVRFYYFRWANTNGKGRSTYILHSAAHTCMYSAIQVNCKKA